MRQRGGARSPPTLDKAPAGISIVVARPSRYQLRLYIAGQSARSIAAISNLKRLCDAHLDGRHAIEVIDLLEQPHLAKADDIVALPTLVRQLPPPSRKIIGDLSNVDRVLLGLNIVKLDAPSG